jgi:multiple sugar transport system substrate-binding protein
MSRPVAGMGRWPGHLAWSLWILGLWGLSGCSDQDRPLSSGPVKPSFPGVRLAVGALGDSAILSGLPAQRGEWIASRKGEITIKDEPNRSLDNLSDLDLLIFPGQELGNLVDADVLEIIPNQTILPPRPPEDETAKHDRTESTEESPAEAFHYTDIAPVYREQVTKYGADRLALPLGGSALVLVYRRDAFSRQANIDAARGAGITLQPPSTWAQLDALARFFQGRDWSGDGTPDHGIAAVLGQDSEGLGNTTYLARAASLAQHRDQYSFLFDSDSMTPRIDSPPFVEALRGIIAWKSHGPPGIDRFDGPGAREAFRAGKTALLIDRAERALAWSGGHAVGVAPLPGSERVFEPLRQQWETPSSPNAPSYLPLGGGWLVGVKRGLSGIQLDAALDLAQYLASPENSNRLCAEPSFPMLPVRSSQMGHGLADPTSAPDVDSRQWSDAVSRTLMAGRVVPGLRIPAAAGYLEDLARARLAALAGKDPESALREASSAWTARTKALGMQRQLWHYRRSLNSLATIPLPPQQGN